MRLFHLILIVACMWAGCVGDGSGCYQVGGPFVVEPGQETTASTSSFRDATLDLRIDSSQGRARAGLEGVDLQEVLSGGRYSLPVANVDENVTIHRIGFTIRVEGREVSHGAWQVEHVVPPCTSNLDQLRIGITIDEDLIQTLYVSWDEAGFNTTQELAQRRASA